jgi:hypothetical protein
VEIAGPLNQLPLVLDVWDGGPGPRNCNQPSSRHGFCGVGGDKLWMCSWHQRELWKNVGPRPNTIIEVDLDVACLRAPINQP